MSVAFDPLPSFVTGSLSGTYRITKRTSAPAELEIDLDDPTAYTWECLYLSDPPLSGSFTFDREHGNYILRATVTASDGNQAVAKQPITGW